jgi:acyl-CoA dehydrogenase
VTEITHIRILIAHAFARLVAMKLFAYRALDYLQVAHSDDRRFLLYHAVQKAKVSTEGVKVIGLLSECIGAKGFEAETYFESALREAQMIPGLEGSTHINFGLTAEFTHNYFAGRDGEAPVPASLISNGADASENPYWFDSRDRTAKTVRFAHYLSAYLPLQAAPNVCSFVEQVTAFRLFAENSISGLSPLADAGVLIGIGKCLASIAYAQLVAENCLLAQIAPATISVIFHGLSEDLSAESLKLSALFPPGSSSREMLKRVVCVPSISAADLEYVSGFLASRFGPKGGQ